MSTLRIISYISVTGDEFTSIRLPLSPNQERSNEKRNYSGRNKGDEWVRLVKKRIMKHPRNRSIDRRSIYDFTKLNDHDLKCLQLGFSTLVKRKERRSGVPASVQIPSIRITRSDNQMADYFGRMK